MIKPKHMEAITQEQKAMKALANEGHWRLTSGSIKRSFNIMVSGDLNRLSVSLDTGSFTQRVIPIGVSRQKIMDIRDFFVNVCKEYDEKNADELNKNTQQDTI